MTIWCITGLDSPLWVQNIKENFCRAKEPNSRLVVVENGAGVGLWGEPGRFSPVHVIESDLGCSEYINAGLAFVRERALPGDWFVKMDSDDYYGYGWLRQHVFLASAAAAALAACSVFIRLSDYRLLFVDYDVEQGEVIGSDKVVHGPTLASRVDVAVDFPKPKEPWGEDGEWVDVMRSNGVQFRALSPYGFTYCRHTHRKHSFPLSDGVLRHVYAEAKVYDLGLWNRDVVDGRKSFQRTAEIPFNPTGMMAAGEQLMAAAKERI